MNHRTWVAHLEHEAAIDPVVFDNLAEVDVTRLPPPSSQARLPPDFPTFRTEGGNSHTDPVSFLRAVENHMNVHSVDREMNGLWIVYRFSNPDLGNQLLPRLASGSARTHWRRVAMVFLAVAPWAETPEDALHVLQRIRFTPNIGVAAFIVIFDTLRFRAGPRLLQHEAVSLFYRALPRDLMVVVKASAGDAAGTNVDIWRIYSTLQHEERNLPLILADDPEYCLEKRKHREQIAARYGLRCRPVEFQTHGGSAPCSPQRNGSNPYHPHGESDPRSPHGPARVTASGCNHDDCRD
ncbi:hypothetical protein H4R19_003957 [Coemansia spiralis]|nr:hypothetical protein H4R19_003957 [Coemansia spiralis]